MVWCLWPSLILIAFALVGDLLTWRGELRNMITNWILILSGLFILFILLAYVNHSPDRVSFLAKLVGIGLVTGHLIAVIVAAIVATNLVF